MKVVMKPGYQFTCKMSLEKFGKGLLADSPFVIAEESSSKR